MAFTTATVASIDRARKQFQGGFSEQWYCNFTVNPSSVAAGAEDSATFTVPGVALGDIVLFSAGVDLTATGEILAFAYVSAADTVTIKITNLNAGSAADLGSSTWKVAVLRPAW